MRPTTYTHVLFLALVTFFTTAPSTQSLEVPELLTTNQCQRRANSAVNYAFIRSGLVPDVVPIAPATRLRVIYAATAANRSGEELEVRLGNELTPAQTSAVPVRVEWDLTPLVRLGPTELTNPSQLYTLALIDPDAYRNGSSLLEYHHWLVVNIPSTPAGGRALAGGGAGGGDQWAPYVGPAPPQGSGLHRYAFLLYAQPFGRIPTVDAELNDTNNTLRRFGWRTGEMVGRHRMGSPVAGNFFYAQFNSG